MYGYITPDGTVGQLFQRMPEAGLYHPDFLAAVIKLPTGITTGWRLIDGEWLPPLEPEPPGQDELEALRLRVDELTRALDALLGGGVSNDQA